MLKYRQAKLILKHFLMLLAFVITLPVFADKINDLKQSVRSQEQAQLAELIKTHLKDLGLNYIPPTGYLIDPIFDVTNNEITLRELKIAINLTGFFGEKFRTYLQNFVLNYYLNHGYSQTPHQNIPKISVSIEIQSPKLPQVAKWLTALSFLIAWACILLIIMAGLERLRFKFKINTKKNSDDPSHYNREPQVGLDNFFESKWEKKKRLLTQGLTADELATACALKIADICDQSNTKLFQPLTLNAHELEKLEKKLKSVSLLDALKELNKLDLKSKKTAMEHLKINPTIINSLIKHSNT